MTMELTMLRGESALHDTSSAAMMAAYHEAAVALLGRLKAARCSPAGMTRLTVTSPDARLDPRDSACDRLWREVFGGFKPSDIALEAGPASRLTLSLALRPEAASPGDVPVWRGMTSDEIGAAYSARAAVPEHLAIFKRWREAGDRVLAERDAQRDLPYGEAPLQRFDFFPGWRSDAPLLVLIHGGYWQAMDKAEHASLIEGHLDAGWAVALLNYRLCPEATIADQVEDVRQALRHLWHRAERLGFDWSRIQICGHSAGGHLGACLASTDWPALDPAMPPSPLHSVVLVSGLFDLEPMRHMSVGQLLGLPDAGTARALSPLHATPNPSLRLHLAVGERESKEFHRQSLALAECWGSALDGIVVSSVPGTHHFSVMETLADGELLTVSRALMAPEPAGPMG